LKFIVLKPRLHCFRDTSQYSSTNLITLIKMVASRSVICIIAAAAAVNQAAAFFAPAAGASAVTRTTRVTTAAASDKIDDAADWLSKKGRDVKDAAKNAADGKSFCFKA
jgi:hypothetical protein